ncbi:hypothetical protein OG204_19795 [Streptomyces sp. NBC_01387]|uniref:hypothetical protein n=1 Tax=unclassified Streptomyces TaxID=2593676 RepID=UPI002024453F|nr:MULTISPECIES: hypothetical protein [unclassified Streptomyces]MCX4549419.1 hypothetical protein [Streptomyces sp. NBC_01500]WSC20954.1 hypothetical protein OIE60_15415 [Streptomyces sp. NBC_01766]WSV54961.1 hypothetical protein OG282_15355 [Streptomyces sp. NBC_01014]
MAHNPQAPQGPEGNYDPAGSTQMFRAFVDEGAPQSAQPAAPPQQQSGPRIGVIVAVVAVIVVLVGVAVLALG